MKTNDRLYGFIVTEERELPELCATMFRMSHEHTGLELVWLRRDEENKTFGIAFETLPEDDTGVFHILEHSVLAGSDNYPVKEPFVELLKSSMNTFLNAMTFPDKTMYPVSSRNDKDFMNLVRVYLDAVFHPLIYRKPEIFGQEGWHYEFSEDGEVSYKGVVFNEMKGFYTDPDGVLYQAVQRALFPDSPYRFEAGGDPEHIPDLSYQAFVDAHRKFYSPSNAYVFLDGAMDIDAVLELLEEFLHDIIPMGRVALPELQKPVDSGRKSAEYELGENEDPAKRSKFALGRVIGTFNERCRLTAMSVLSQALCGDNQAPLKRAVLSSGLADDVSMGGADNVILQPFVILQVDNIAAEDADRVKEILINELRRLRDEGIDRDRLSASLANLEFHMREMETGTLPQGIILGMQAMETWLYGGHPADNLEIGDLFDTLRRRMDEGYFEQLIDEVLLSNPHRCEVVMTPSKTAGEERRQREAARLKAESEAWSATERRLWEERSRKLEEWQRSEDSPEALALLPKLTLEDVSPEPQLVRTKVAESDGVTLITHEAATNGIVYVKVDFDAGDATEEELSQLNFMSNLLARLSTEKHTSEELVNLRRTLCGNLVFGVTAYKKHNSGERGVNFTATFSTLEKNLDAAVGLMTEILASTRFAEGDEALEILKQGKLGQYQSFLMGGHMAAISRVMAQLTPEGVVGEHLNGLEYYKWLLSTEKNWDWDAMSAKFKSLLARTAVISRLTVSVTGYGEETAKRVLDLVSEALPVGERRETRKFEPWGVRREAIVIPSDICFAVTAGQLPKESLERHGVFILSDQIVGLSYLWSVIRVQGGAYGAGMKSNSAGRLLIYSYRDPAGAASLEKYRAAGSFLREFAGSGADLTGFIIGAVSGTEPYLSPRARGVRGDGNYWSGITDEDQRKWRRELLSAAPEDLAYAADMLDRALENAGVCVVGGKNQIDALGDLDLVETL